MDVRKTDAVPLAPRPNLEQYRTVAKDLVRARRAGGDHATRDWAVAWMDRLAQLQHLTPTPDRVSDFVDGIVRDAEKTRLLETRPDGSGPALSDAQLFIARLHGFESWPKFVKHIEARGQASSPISQFETAADAIVTGDVGGTLSQLLRDHPALIRARSSREHRATLLHYIAANGHEGFRQRTPKNAVEIARLLLDAGAEPDALADMYGYRVTPMEMLVSSAHPHAAGVQVALVDLLLDFGANANGVDDNGSPIMTAFRFHYPAAAEALARRGARIDTVVTAAALGRIDLVDRFVDDNGGVRAEVLLASGPWPKLSRDPAQHLSFALAWACAFGRDDVVELLLRKGVDPSGKDDDLPALHYAAAGGRMHIVRLLLQAGASLETLNSYGGTVLDATVWFALNSPLGGVDYGAVVRELLELGARTDGYPEMQSHVDLVLSGRRGGGYPAD